MEKLSFICTLFLLCGCLYGQTYDLVGEVLNASNEGIPDVEIFVAETKQINQTDQFGTFEIKDLSAGNYTLTTFATGFASQTIAVTIDTNPAPLRIQLVPVNIDLETVEVTDASKQVFALSRLNDVQGTGIYASKKTEVIRLDKLVANLATNNPRQVYASIPGLNIWENDGAGLQLGIGARGLDPNRTSNFNTRQNGYDISADALGYPESYYTPPTEALQKIEVVRGAASLQYGPQFGGLLNFQFKDGNIAEKFKLTLSNTLGSFKFWNSFTGIEGKVNKIQYYAFYQRKQGDGWRANSMFDQNTAYGSVAYQISSAIRIKADYTYMDYLAQQSGGLVDFEFEANPRQSNRERNWFKVNWQLAALHFDYAITEKIKWNTRVFYLNAGRQALGYLGPINRPDPLRERDLIRGSYKNWGIESRLLKRYLIGDNIQNFLVGMRYYDGMAHSQQGNADATAAPHFSFLNPDELEKSDYLFPSQNLSFFVENLFNINAKWSVTPGVRWEYIQTSSDGYFTVRFDSGGQTIASEQFYDSKENTRYFPLFGLGSSYRFSDKLELYANASQNYRSINFTDLAIVNTNLVVDSLLQDESGYNIDLGARGKMLNDRILFDASLFYLKYNNRIGIGSIVYDDPFLGEKASPYRTNIGDADILGLESYLEGRHQFFANKKQPLETRLFVNLALIHGKYTSGASDFIHNKVELIPPFNIKTGLKFNLKNFGCSYQYSYTQTHFTDATNASWVADATRGLIPAYGVHDVSMSYDFSYFKLKASVNNLLNTAYFTRRANAYPGPGIIPADGRAFYVNLIYELARK